MYANSSTPKPDRVEEWAFGYLSHHDIYNSAGSGISYATSVGIASTVLPSEEEIDILITHGSPKYRFDMTEQGGKYRLSASFSRY